MDVKQNQWPDDLAIDIVFSANTAHIMSKVEVEAFFSGVGRQLTLNGIFILYGPFNYNGHYSAESNARFDIWLKQRDPNSCIKDFEFLNFIAAQAGLEFLQKIDMPANNQILCWQKKS